MEAAENESCYQPTMEWNRRRPDGHNDCFRLFCFVAFRCVVLRCALFVRIFGSVCFFFDSGCPFCCWTSLIEVPRLPAVALARPDHPYSACGSLNSKVVRQTNLSQISRFARRRTDMAQRPTNRSPSHQPTLARPAEPRS